MYLKPLGTLSCIEFVLQKALLPLSLRLWGSGLISKFRLATQWKARYQHLWLHLKTEASGGNSPKFSLFQLALDNPWKVQMLPGDLSERPRGTPGVLWKQFSARCLIFSSLSTQITPKHFYFFFSSRASSVALFFVDRFWKGEKTLEQSETGDSVWIFK